MALEEGHLVAPRKAPRGRETGEAATDDRDAHGAHRNSRTERSRGRRTSPRAAQHLERDAVLREVLRALATSIAPVLTAAGSARKSGEEANGSSWSPGAVKVAPSSKAARIERKARRRACVAEGP
jgi:hypothetical protein